ncbi:MAG: excinuclease ABC subunit UvrA [Actinomycetota bacterium]|nr:excinuclease ABC subunit UvrA [Actinomycetota bacterium]MDK1017393.1 excinuclease ABC subunit UvrA [Actinomycetota bacterium]MDK1027330.1 excinuclease ABC subunit UvrA [Actinomycetota bacterium]MDK1039349.1 excinuclease ABC subunit UvrA [Actinomycetota bacterium]MDK1097479.1 excinuclease ABC subunit UvrA [Actinomycetota bacterium]
MASEEIVIQGAREHNLKNIDLTLPRNQLIVFTGLSGSGKSSLAFDTIYAEGQRRYVESLSAYARQFLGQMDKPDVDFIEGLSPAISIDQKTAGRNPRSTVGTVTEIHDYLRLLYARIGVPHCPNDGSVVTRQTPQQIVDRVLELEDGTRFQVLAPVVRGRKGEYESLVAELVKDGFSRARIDGEVRSLTEGLDLARYEQHTIEVVVDRLVRSTGMERRLADSMETALQLGEGTAIVDIIDGPSLSFSQAYSCPMCALSFEELQPRNFSFNSPYGACQGCSGIGTKYQVDAELVVPQPDLSLSEGAIAPWRGRHRMTYYQRLISSVAEVHDIEMGTPWHSLSDDAKELLLHGGGGGAYTVRYENRFGRQRSYSANYEGALNWVDRRYRDSESDGARASYQQYMREIPCTRCDGGRLNAISLAVTIGGRSIAQISNLSLGVSRTFLGSITLEGRDRTIAEPVLKEIEERLSFLVSVGLDYLTLARSAATLAGGEAQRIRLATQIGSGLVGVLYILDEPSIGLHQRDNQRLIETLLRLRDLGNTLIVVEHDEDTIRVADQIVDIGPGAGEHGGQIVAQGQVADLEAEPKSITGMYLSGARTIPTPTQRRPGRGESIDVFGAAENNLKDIDVSFPLGTFTAVTGVSGSGKSTLVDQILSRALHASLHGARKMPGRYRRIDGLEHIDKVIKIDQSPIGRTPRSNSVTYTKVFDAIRQLFAATPDAKMRGYKPGRFSFNVAGGRCETCKGDGTLKIEMHFLPDVYVQCDTCEGLRYNRDTLEVQFKGHSIADVLDMSIEEAVAFFENQPRISRVLGTLFDVGLGYVRLGQPAPTLSGGEAQRVKLAAELSKRSTGRTLYILDEPTTGLHFDDIRKLLGVLQRLVDGGNTVVVIEHNLDVVKSVDWVIDLGPDGGEGGGEVVAVGTPEQVADVSQSYTGKFLRDVL